MAEKRGPIVSAFADKGTGPHGFATFPKSKWKDAPGGFQVEIRLGISHGVGIFAVSAIEEGTTIYSCHLGSPLTLKFTKGDLDMLSKEECDFLLEYAAFRSDYMCWVHRADSSMFFNHSANSNARVCRGDADVFTIVATRHIAAGEEICVNYLRDCDDVKMLAAREDVSQVYPDYILEDMDALYDDFFAASYLFEK
mmetsp:Transcript_24988/g.59205  ORF Transcript_24988/g.59205 Transcript_24988/m.59205 type:complete len:196 (+) Transcript_24988:100-687(+)